MSKHSQHPNPMQDDVRELSLHEYELVAGGDGDGDGDNSEASGNNPDVNNPGSSGGGVTQQGATGPGGAQANR